MNEVKTPKKPLIFYYVMVFLLLMMLNFMAIPWTPTSRLVLDFICNQVHWSLTLIDTKTMFLTIVNGGLVALCSSLVDPFQAKLLVWLHPTAIQIKPTGAEL